MVHATSNFKFWLISHEIIAWNASKQFLYSLLLCLARRRVSQYWNIQFEPSICDAHCTIHWGQEQRDKGVCQLPGGEREYKFTEDFQRPQAKEVKSFHPIKKGFFFSEEKRGEKSLILDESFWFCQQFSAKASHLHCLDVKCSQSQSQKSALNFTCSKKW